MGGRVTIPTLTKQVRIYKYEVVYLLTISLVTQNALFLALRDNNLNKLA